MVQQDETKTELDPIRRNMKIIFNSLNLTPNTEGGNSKLSGRVGNILNTFNFARMDCLHNQVLTHNALLLFHRLSSNDILSRQRDVASTGNTIKPNCFGSYYTESLGYRVLFQP